jgi:hypothetical protein
MKIQLTKDYFINNYSSKFDKSEIESDLQYAFQRAKERIEREIINTEPMGEIESPFNENSIEQWTDLELDVATAICYLTDAFLSNSGDFSESSYSTNAGSVSGSETTTTKDFDF